MADDIFFQVEARCRPHSFRERNLRGMSALMHEWARNLRTELCDVCRCRGQAAAEAAACLEACVPVGRAQLRRACGTLRLPVPEVWVDGHRI
jgi:hypothetical protein